MLSFRITRKGSSLLWVLLAVTLAGCGGGKTTSTSSSSTLPVSKVTLAPTNASVGVNQTQIFGATSTDSNGTILTNQTYTWTSSAPNIARINDAGVATGQSIGTTQITASTTTFSGSSSSSNTVTVTSAPVTLTVTATVASITIAPASATISVGGTQQFTATALDANNNAVSGVVFSWFSSNAGIATIDPTGLAKGISTSQNPVTIQASANGVSSNMATLKVQ